MKDLLNREILIGDIIAYPVRKSSSLWMEHGEVKQIITSGRHALKLTRDGRTVTVFNINNCVICGRVPRLPEAVRAARLTVETPV